jgi:uncharacterized protein YaaQ
MPLNKMVMAIVEREETARVLEALISAGYTATFGDSRSGVLRQARQTLFIGVDAERLEEVLTIIRDNCRSHVPLASTGTVPSVPMPPRRTLAEVGSAVVFVWDIDRFETF